MSSFYCPFRIAIIGAGPAGCTLARLLLRANIPVTIFAGKTSPDIRSQGGTLDLHEDTGLAALREAGLYDQFLKFARFDGDALTVCDKKMLRYLDLKSSREGGWFSQRRRPHTPAPVAFGLFTRRHNPLGLPPSERRPT